MSSAMKHFVLSLLVLLQGAALPAASGPKDDDRAIFKLAGEAINNPESVYLSGDVLYISNMAGAGDLKDSLGWISKADRRGNILDGKWVDQLNAPKGMRAFKGLLFVADIDEVVLIQLKTGKILQKLKIEGAKLLNDVAVDKSGSVYVSDTRGNAIYKLTLGKSGEWSYVPFATNLEYAPNGLLVVKEELIVAGYYSNVGEDPAAYNKKPLGQLFALSLKNGSVKRFITKKPLGSLDGIERARNGDWIVSAKRQSKLYRVRSKDGMAALLIEGDDALDIADIAFDPAANLIYIPSTAGSWVRSVRIP